jgi:Cu/Ag efflux protein CusF
LFGSPASFTALNRACRYGATSAARAAACLQGIMRAVITPTFVIGLLIGGVTLAQTSMIDGQVTKIDEAAGKITIRHGPLNIGMDEPMIMLYRADDAALFKNVKPGDKIRFMVDRVNDQFTVTKIEKAR